MHFSPNTKKQENGVTMQINRQDLERFLNETFWPGQYKDYGPNGLQIEGVDEIEQIAFAVSATRDSIQAAIEKKADALIVHHGILWDFHGVRPLVGPFGIRVRLLVKNDINLFAYHLPLDGHLEFGNASCLAQLLRMQELSSFGDYKGLPTGVQGKLSESLLPDELKTKLEEILQHQVLLSTPDANFSIRTLGIITGGANSGWKEAARAGLDAYLTGEMSEHDWHEAKESGIHMFAGGHYATEAFGIKRLMKEVQEQFQVNCFFVDSENPA